ncbi:MAG: molybdenum cofactor biosynthesis protein MoaE [Pseudomonadota bacterium]
MHDIRLSDARLDPSVCLAALDQATHNAGGIASFLGKVRANDRPNDGVEALELSHYEPLTLPGMEDLGARASARFSLMGLVMVHRIGMLYPGDPIVLVAAAARHRRDAIAAVDFCMDHLKSAAWFWKREKRADGWHWIEPRASDHQDLARW